MPFPGKSVFTKPVSLSTISESAWKQVADAPSDDMITAAALLFIVIFGLVIILWPVIGRLVVLALAIVLISDLIQMLKANAAELLQPEHIYRYKGGCDID